jgi:hypothetical protein
VDAIFTSSRFWKDGNVKLPLINMGEFMYSPNFLCLGCSVRYMKIEENLIYC